MSEYQYYEFQVVDRPLTEEQMDELRSYSTRAEITPRSFTNFYNWDDFKGDPNEWIEKYFDSFLYLANWGTRWLMFRIPKRLLSPDTVSMYCADETLDYHVNGADIIVSFKAEEVERNWVEGEGWLDRLMQLRSDLMHGDHRCLYLAWLRAVQEEMVCDDDPEPPIPPGMAKLNAPLRNLAEFLDIDSDLIDAAARKSAKKADFSLSKKSIRNWVAKLPLKDRNAIITGLIEGKNPHIAAELRQKALYEIRAKENPKA